jgi:hypothetical protein
VTSQSSGSPPVSPERDSVGLSMVQRQGSRSGRVNQGEDMKSLVAMNLAKLKEEEEDQEEEDDEALVVAQQDADGNSSP